jgi:hypothetical protein
MGNIPKKQKQTKKKKKTVASLYTNTPCKQSSTTQINVVNVWRNEIW